MICLGHCLNLFQLGLNLTSWVKIIILNLPTEANLTQNPETKCYSENQKVS